LTAELRREGWEVNAKRVARLMGVMGIEAIYPKRSTSAPQPGHEIYPYLLRGKEVSGPDQVWSADLTCDV
jgi:putative transposase